MVSPKQMAVSCPASAAGIALTVIDRVVSTVVQEA